MVSWSVGQLERKDGKTKINTVESGKWKVESSKWKVERKDGKTKINTVESGKWKVESVKSSGK